MNEKEYYTLVVKEFPLMENKITLAEEDVCFSNMEEFAIYTNEQIKSGDFDELKRIFSFLESKIEEMNSLLENALNVSYFEALLLGKNSTKMKEVIPLMPKKLKSKYQWYSDYYDMLGKASKKL